MYVMTFILEITNIHTGDEAELHYITEWDKCRITYSRGIIIYHGIK